MAAYGLAVWTGREADLLALRNVPLSEANRADVEQALTVIRTMPVAGWDDQGEPNEHINDAHQVR